GHPLIVDYHNITPAEYFDRWEPAAAASMRLARAELAALSPAVGLGLADSSFNRAELDDLGYAHTATAPLLVDLGPFRRLPGPRPPATGASPNGAPTQSRPSGARWLFVGRVAPNKCQHDLIAAFAVYRRLYDPAASLALVGGATSPRYRGALQRMAANLGLGTSVQLLGGLPFPRLLAEYASADVFVCLSEHEGFCAPLLEAMQLGVPTVAYAAAAVPETLGQAGILLGGKDPLHVALAVGGLLADPELRRSLVDAGLHRASELGLAASSKTFLATLTGWLAETG
ncbi:MAG: glycosyltransferase, partial [Acidimicrobiales bacterium]